MWKELLQKLTKECEFAPPASAIQIMTAEQSLSINFPESLRGLLYETDGVQGEYELSLIWPIGRIIEDNLTFRENENFRDIYMPFTHLLFFADAGNGDQFAFSIQADGMVHRPDIFAWNHEDDSRKCVAPSLERYLEWWLTGKIKL